MRVCASVRGGARSRSFASCCLFPIHATQLACNIYLVLVPSHTHTPSKLLLLLLLLRCSAAAIVAMRTGAHLSTQPHMYLHTRTHPNIPHLTKHRHMQERARRLDCSTIACVCGIRAGRSRTRELCVRTRATPHAAQRVVSVCARSSAVSAQQTKRRRRPWDARVSSVVTVEQSEEKPLPSRKHTASPHRPSVCHAPSYRNISRACVFVSDLVEQHTNIRSSSSSSVLSSARVFDVCSKRRKIYVKIYTAVLCVTCAHIRCTLIHTHTHRHSHTLAQRWITMSN